VWEGNSSVFADGVWFIELAALIRGAMDSALLTQAIAGAFKQSGQVEPITLNLLQESLAGKQMLLILDNCEHLVDACAEIAERLLHRCWQLHILATSREKLRVPGEMVYAVPPLALPDPAARTPAHVLSTPAARLFVERIGIAPSIHKTREEDAVAIAQICRQLDGIPLALELAAPLAHNMTFTEIAAQLHNQMAILTNNYRTAIPRHQTMYSALVWGYHLLAPDEQQLLARVSVFAGGWTLTACQSVCGAESGNSLLLPLHQLVAKSFVLVAYLDGERRYHLLEPIRQFAHAQLVASGEQETTRRRHAAYYLTLAAEMGQARDTPQEQAWLQRLEPERNNLRAVNEWALAHNEAEFARQFNGLLFVYWIYCSSQAEADHWLEAALGLQAIEGNGARTPTALSAEIMALDAAGYAAVGLLDYERAQAHFAHEMALCAAIGDQKGVAAALRGCGFTGMLAGDLVQAQVCDEDALALSKKAQDHRGIAWVLYDLGYLALVRGELNVAQALLEEALPSLRQLGINFGAYRALLALGHVARASGEPDRAGGLYRDALRLQQAMHYTQYVADGLEGLAGIAAQAGDPVRAAWLFAAAQTQRDAIAMSHWQHQVAGYERDVELARRQLDPESWRTAWEAGSVMTLKQAVEHALSS
jgi:non-specific serine/threonine protein kinase